MHIRDFENYFATGHLLAVLPISRMHVEMEAIAFPRGAFVCPPGCIDINSLHIRKNQLEGGSLSEAQSAATGVDLDIFASHPLVLFPCHFNWTQFQADSHKNHLRFLRTLSQYVDSTFLDAVRFNFCRLGLADTLPGRAGSLYSTPMFAAAALFNPKKRQGRLIAGAAFTHAITVGLGLALEPVAEADFPRDGEVGRIAQHGLSLYRDALEAYDHTSRFVRAMTLLEFLANPIDFENFKTVKKTIARYVAKDKADYEQWLEWFFNLTGRRDPVTGQFIGLRTRIVHLGHKLEDCLSDDGIADLYRQLDRVIGKVITHLIQYSKLDWNDYLAVRDTVGPFASMETQ